MNSSKGSIKQKIY